MQDGFRLEHRGQLVAGLHQRGPLVAAVVARHVRARSGGHWVQPRPVLDAEVRPADPGRGVGVEDGRPDGPPTVPGVRRPAHRPTPGPESSGPRRPRQSELGRDRCPPTRARVIVVQFGCGTTCTQPNGAVSAAGSPGSGCSATRTSSIWLARACCPSVCTTRSTSARRLGAGRITERTGDREASVDDVIDDQSIEPGRRSTDGDGTAGAAASAIARSPSRCASPRHTRHAAVLFLAALTKLSSAAANDGSCQGARRLARPKATAQRSARHASRARDAGHRGAAACEARPS